MRGNYTLMSLFLLPPFPSKIKLIKSFLKKERNGSWGENPLSLKTDGLSCHLKVLFIYLFIFRERERERERQGEKHQCVVASSTPLRTWPLTQAYAMTRN